MSRVGQLFYLVGRSIPLYQRCRYTPLSSVEPVPHGLIRPRACA